MSAAAVCSCECGWTLQRGALGHHQQLSLNAQSLCVVRTKHRAVQTSFVLRQPANPAGLRTCAIGINTRNTDGMLTQHCRPRRHNVEGRALLPLLLLLLWAGVAQHIGH